MVDRAAALFKEVEEALAAHQPKLTATRDSDCIRVTGEFVCESAEGPFDQYQVEMVIPWAFPEKEPAVYEIGERIPRTAAMHVYPSTGACCLGLWEIWRLRNPEPNFDAFLTTHVRSYFVGQTVHLLTGEWFFGEEGHSSDEIAQSYLEAIDFPADSNRRAFFDLLCSAIPSNPRCPCGSGKKFSVCHRQYLRDLRRRIPASVRNAMRNRIAKTARLQK